MKEETQPRRPEQIIKQVEDLARTLHSARFVRFRVTMTEAMDLMDHLKRRGREDPGHLNMPPFFQIQGIKLTCTDIPLDASGNIEWS